jgi:hypothetical protein
MNCFPLLLMVLLSGALALGQDNTKTTKPEAVDASAITDQYFKA